MPDTKAGGEGSQLKWILSGSKIGRGSEVGLKDGEGGGEFDSSARSTNLHFGIFKMSFASRVHLA